MKTQLSNARIQSQFIDNLISAKETASLNLEQTNQSMSEVNSATTRVEVEDNVLND